MCAYGCVKLASLVANTECGKQAEDECVTEEDAGRAVADVGDIERRRRFEQKHRTTHRHHGDGDVVGGSTK